LRIGGFSSDRLIFQTTLDLSQASDFRVLFNFGYTHFRRDFRVFFFRRKIYYPSVSAVIYAAKNFGGEKNKQPDPNKSL
jgi:hypothetical protein